MLFRSGVETTGVASRVCARVDPTPQSPLESIIAPWNPPSWSRAFARRAPTLTPPLQPTGY
eukprot:10654830-Alexandrium_andersonii.AAC.2